MWPGGPAYTAPMTIWGHAVAGLPGERAADRSAPSRHRSTSGELPVQRDPAQRPSHAPAGRGTMSELPPDRPLVDYDGRRHRRGAGDRHGARSTRARSRAHARRSLRGAARLALRGARPRRDGRHRRSRRRPRLRRLGRQERAGHRHRARRLALRPHAADRDGGREPLPRRRTAGSSRPPWRARRIIVSNQAEGSTQILVRTIAITPDLPSGGSSRRPRRRARRRRHERAVRPVRVRPELLDREGRTVRRAPHAAAARGPGARALHLQVRARHRLRRRSSCRRARTVP